VDVVRFLVDVMRFVVDAVRFVVDIVRFVVVVRFVVDAVRFVVDVMRFIVDVVRFVVDAVRFILDVVTFVVDARAELVRTMCISQHYRITDFLETNLKVIAVDILVVTDVRTVNTTYGHYSCTHVPCQENGKCTYPAN
jgi:hypothetical protein